MRTKSRVIVGVIAATLLTQLSACGTIFYPDRRGQIEGKIDPVGDADTIETELMLADLESLERRVEQTRKRAASKDKESTAQLPIMEQVVKLLNEGKTDLLPGFVSQRTRRAFKAFLVRGKDGKISFEFEERKAKPGAKGKATDAEAGAGADGADGAAAAPVKAARKAPAKAAA